MELMLDPNIRKWVFIPIVLMTFLLGLLKHYLSVWLDKDVGVTLQQVQERQFLMRCHVLRINAAYIPKPAFTARRIYFTNESLHSRVKIKPVDKFAAFDPNTFFNMFKNNLINVLPMFLIGGWIMYMFSGFIATRMPFALTIRFKSMLQREIVLKDLNASWVSSASWYFLSVCGLRNVFSLVLGENNMADPGRDIEENLIGSSNTNNEAVFVNELEELQMVEHDWILNELKN